MWCTCERWEIRDAASVLDDYVCRKCTQLQLLTVRMDRLEQQLDARRSMKEAESIIDRSFRDMGTVKAQADRWVTARRGRQSVQESLVVISLSNKYTVFDTVGGDGLSGDTRSSSQSSRTTAGSVVKQGGTKRTRTIVKVDSIVRVQIDVSVDVK